MSGESISGRVVGDLMPHISPFDNKSGFESTTSTAIWHGRAAIVGVAIGKERLYQDQKHGSIVECGHTLGEWILIAEAELAEAKEALIKGGSGRDSVRSELVQVAATIVACLEQHGLSEPHSRRQI